MTTKIAKTVAEAVEGDLLWRYDPQMSRRDEFGVYKGRGVWSLICVTKVGRLSVEVRREKYARDTGEMRKTGGFANTPYLRGAAERESDWWLGQRRTLAEAIRDITDIETLKSVNHLLGHGKPPSFTEVPEGTEIP